MMTFWIALGSAVLGAASLLLHFIAPRTRTKVDDTILEYVDKGKDALSK